MLSHLDLRAVVFDYAGTLATVSRPEEALADLYREIASSMSNDFPQATESTIAVIHTAISERLTREATSPAPAIHNEALYIAAYAEAGILLAPPDARKIIDAEQRAWRGGIGLARGARALLSKVTSMGLKVGLLSNAPFRVSAMEAQLDELGIRKWFDVIAFSGSTGLVKPDPEAFLSICERLGTEPAQTLMIGDSVEVDINGATRAGMPSLYIGTSPGVHVTTALAHVPSLDAILELLQG